MKKVFLILLIGLSGLTQAAEPIANAYGETMRYFHGETRRSALEPLRPETVEASNVEATEYAIITKQYQRVVDAYLKLSLDTREYALALLRQQAGNPDSIETIRLLTVKQQEERRIVFRQKAQERERREGEESRRALAERAQREACLQEVQAERVQLERATAEREAVRAQADRIQAEKTRLETVAIEREKQERIRQEAVTEAARIQAEKIQVEREAARAQQFERVAAEKEAARARAERVRLEKAAAEREAVRIAQVQRARLEKEAAAREAARIQAEREKRERFRQQAAATAARIQAEREAVRIQAEQARMRFEREIAERRRQVGKAKTLEDVMLEARRDTALLLGRFSQSASGSRAGIRTSSMPATNQARNTQRGSLPFLTKDPNL